MSFLTPLVAAVAAALTIPPLVALYFLKLRRRVLPVSSTLLWKKAIQDLQVNSPFQRMRRNLLLLLQLLALILLLLVLARPTTQGAALEGERLVIVIDQSASMNATDVAPTRLEHAKDRALQIIDTLATEGDAKSAMIVAFGERARVLQPFTTDRRLLRSAVQRIEPTDQPSRLGSALALIEPFAMSTTSEAAQNQDTAVVLLSDGRLQDAAELELRGADLRFERIGAPSDVAPPNLAIVAMNARRDYLDPELTQVFVRLHNFGREPVSTNVNFSVDGEVVRVEAVNVAGATDEGPGAESLQLDVDLLGSALVEAEHDGDDDLAADDAARVVVAPPRQSQVLLVTRGNPFLERAIDAAGVRRLVVMTPNQYRQLDPESLTATDGSGFDLLVFDGVEVESVPPIDSVSFNTAPPLEGLSLEPWSEGSPRAQVVLNWRTDHPLLRHVNLSEVIVVEPGRLVLPTGAPTLASGVSGPLMAVVTDRGLQHVVVGFDVLNSDWPMQVGFSIFMTNVLQGLGYGRIGTDALAFSPGEAAVAPVRGEDPPQRVTYDGPVTLRAPVDGGRAALPVFERVGLYEASTDAVPEPWDRLAVNLLDEVESDLRAVDQLIVGSTGGDGTAPVRSATVRREVWHWFALAALAMLAIEWIVYLRRAHV